MAVCLLSRLALEPCYYVAGSGSSRRKAEQVLYNSAADAAMSPKLRDASPYGVISSSNVRPAREAMKERSLSREATITAPSPRPRTPTQEERLQRLLKPDEREFVVVEEDRHRYRLKSPLKEIAKPANHHSQPEVSLPLSTATINHQNAVAASEN